MQLTLLYTASTSFRASKLSGGLALHSAREVQLLQSSAQKAQKLFTPALAQSEPSRTPAACKGKDAPLRQQQQRKQLSVYRDEEGEAFRPGDSAYVVLDADRYDEANEGEEPCEICGQAGLTGSSGEETPMLECSGCLRGYHISCLTPPLQQVPEVSPNSVSTTSWLDRSSSNELAEND